MRITAGTVFRVMLVRLLEMFVCCAALSSVLTAIDQFTSYGGTYVFFAVTVALAVAYIGINIYLSRQCCVELLSYGRYYAANITAYIIFAITSIVGWGMPASNWLFKILTTFRIFIEGIDMGGDYTYTVQFCMLVFHVLILFILFIAPVGLSNAIAAMRRELRENGLEE